MKKKIAFMLCVAMLLSLVLAGCAKTIAIETDLTNLELDGAEEGKTGEDYSATLVPEDDYLLPEEITVRVDGEKLSDKKYEYDPESGELTIPGDEITGDIEIIAEAEKPTVVGEWTGTLDMTQMINEMIGGSDPTLAEYFTFSDMSFGVNMEFTEDGSCTLSVDGASIVELAERMREQLKNGMDAYLASQIEALGLTMSVDEFLEIAGYTMDSFIDESFPVEELVEEMADLSETGTYEAEDDLLHLSLSDFSADGNPYTLKDDKLTIEAAGDEGESSAFIFPMVLKRVS